MAAEFDGHAAEHKKPEHHHQRQIETAEARGVEQGKSEVERATRSEKPNLVPIPHRANRANHLAALGISLCDKQMNGAGAEIESIENDVHGQHQRHKTEPHVPHSTCSSGAFCFRFRPALDFPVHQKEKKNS
jgi:hypothetical protein